MSKTFNIYCDESTHMMHDGHPYMLLSYTSIAYPQIRMAKAAIKAIKEKHNYTEELKWTNVHQATYKVYADLIDWFFMNDLEFRAIIIDKSEIDESRKDYTYNDFYYKMYYNVYLDIKDTCSSAKLARLKKIMENNSSIRTLQFIRSHESVFVQLADVLMGAINYNLRLEKGDVQGTMKAKLNLIEKIKKHSDISFNSSTSLSGSKSNTFFISLK